MMSAYFLLSQFLICFETTIEAENCGFHVQNKNRIHKRKGARYIARIWKVWYRKNKTRFGGVVVSIRTHRGRDGSPRQAIRNHEYIRIPNARDL
jgi:hypothetical protein